VFNNRTDAEVGPVCDREGGRAEAFAREGGVGAHYHDYERFLRHGLDAVVVATPLPVHAKQSVLALEAGCHVLSEVPAANSLEECGQIVQAVRRSGMKYMMAENSCYMAYLQSWRQMVADGRIGHAIYAEAEYVHNCRAIMRDPDGGLTWRAGMPPIYYCTHSLGPLLMIMEDRCVTATGLHTGPHVAPDLGAIDLEVGLFRTAKGGVIKILNGFSVVREPAFHYYVVYGSKGVLETGRPGDAEGTKAFFADVPHLQGMARLPLTTSHTGAPPEARAGGHGTTEYYMVEDFIRAIREDTSPAIDVYRAMDYGVPGLCAHLSAERGGAPVEVPDFREM
jgi:predicted dehydrogenase